MWGLAAELRLRGLNVDEQENHRLLIRQTYETNSIGKNDHTTDILKPVRENPQPDDFVYVAYSFFYSTEQHKNTVRRYLDDKQHYVLVFPDTHTRDVDKLSIYIFRRNIYSPP